MYCYMIRNLSSNLFLFRFLFSVSHHYRAFLLEYAL